MTLVLDFAAIDSSMIELVGGKAVNLGVMAAADLPVPGGFCVSTEAYRAVVGTTVDDQIASLDGSDVGDRAEHLREHIAGLPLPPELVTTIVEHYRALGDNVPVAVRSSATAEDLAYASFAGQQDTYLNVVGEDALLDAVRRCWASLWTDRAVSYRDSQHIDQHSVSLAVIVQRMVDSAVAGVMFTANPVTGARQQTVIDASPGLGEAVVSGAVNPDHFVVDRTTGSIVERNLGTKTLVISSRPGGGTDHRERADDGEPCLDDDQVLALSALGQRVQDHYAAPQDTEWAIAADGTVWLTQARPITTLYPLVDPAESATRVFMCLTLAQGLTRPITPMGLAAFRLIGSSVATAVGLAPDDPRSGPRAMHSPGGRVYLDVTSVLRNRFGRRLMLTAFSVMEARAATVLRRLIERPEFSILPASAVRSLRPVAQVVVLRARFPLRIATALVSPRLARRAIDRLERRLRASVMLPANATPVQRLDLVERKLGTDTFLLMPTGFAYAATGFALLNLARRLLRGLADPDEIQQIQRSLPHNVTTEMDLALWELTAKIRADQDSRRAFTDSPAIELSRRYREHQLPSVADHGLRVFLHRYGHRAVAEIDLGMPRWSEDPGHLIGMIQNYLRLDDPELAPVAQFAKGAVAAEAMISTLTGRARARGRLRAVLVDWTLHRARDLTGLRESPKFLLVLALAALREHLHHVGAALRADDRIDQVDDVYFLDFAEARRGLDGADLRAVVTERRAAYAAELARRRIPRLLLSDGTEPEAVATVAERPDGALVGSPASVGTVTGRARVVLDPVGAHLEPGEILVAPSTDPGWTPLFLTAGGLVMEMGGSNSHGAVVAREYGIPAVVGVPDATHRIETGQSITVDGASGLVFATQ